MTVIFQSMTQPLLSLSCDNVLKGATAYTVISPMAWEQG